jgi:DNA-binding transcriptional regulator YiaG
MPLLSVRGLESQRSSTSASFALVVARCRRPRSIALSEVRLLRSSRKTVPVLARELGVSPQSLRNWATQAEIDAAH